MPSDQWKTWATKRFLVAWQGRLVEQDGGVVMPRKFALKPALLGGLCLILAILLAWFSPKEGVAGLLGMRGGDLAPMKTRVSERDDAAGREVRSVAEEYMIKAERGMTVDEVRWVVEDFQALGLDEDYPEDNTAEGYLGLRKAREEWYLGALVSGLRLTKEQEREAREAMGLLRGRDYAEFAVYLENQKTFDCKGRMMAVVDGGKGRALMDASIWMEEKGYQPWKLCELTKDQLAVTNFVNEIMDEEEAEKFKDWLVGADEVRGGGVKPVVPKDLTKDIGDLYGLGLMGWGYVEAVFPLSKRQAGKLMSGEKVSTGDSLLEATLVFQPEQLKVYLLFVPEAAAILLGELEKESE